MEKIFQDIGRRIREARRRKKLSQESLAEAVGVNPTHISHIENGKGRPSSELLIKVMEYLEIEPNWLFCGSVGTAKPNLLKETELIMEGCDNEQITAMNTVLKTMKESF